MKRDNINLNRIKQGDAAAFKELFESFFVPLREFAMGYVCNDDVASDVAQESLVKYWERRDNFDSIQQVSAFLYNTVRNAVLNEIAHHNVVENYSVRTVNSSPISDNGYEHLFSTELNELRSEVMRAINSEIAAMPKRTRQIVELALKGNSNEEIAASLGVGKETVHTLKRIAIRKLRTRMWSWSDTYKEIKA